MKSLVDCLERRASEQPDDGAFAFVNDRGERTRVLTYLDLWLRAAGLAEALRERAPAGERAMLVYPPGVEFVVAFFGCLVAGLVPAPLMPPRRAASRDASAAILEDCAPRLALTDSTQLEGSADLPSRLPHMPRDGWFATNNVEPARPRDRIARRRCELALLQYTSGSTSAPRGVCVSHANLMANLEMIRARFGIAPKSRIVSWGPLYHDMGLILNALQSVYVGGACVLMAPVTFIQRPMVWLQAISDHRAEIAGAPNFAFDHCVDRLRPERADRLDLSCWRVAFNGSEPVRADTLERFARAFAPFGFDPAAAYPAYGLAEATLVVAAGDPGAGPRTRVVDMDALARDEIEPPGESGGRILVSCGRATPGGRIAIVDPSRLTRLAPGRVGEIWASGPHVAQGYFARPEASRETFQAELQGEEGRWLRTGDLGFLDEEGCLFVTGRMKDLIIIRGVNRYPQDIERTAESAHPALQRHGSAAFGVEGPRGEERLVLVLELARSGRMRAKTQEIEDCVREAVADEHEASVFDIALIRPGSLPKTTSGKIQRSAARRFYLDGRLDRADAQLAQTQDA